MKTLVIFYSYTGTAKRLALNFAVQSDAETLEIQDDRRPGKFKAYTSGCLAALQGKTWAIKPPEADLAAYNRLVLFTPIWANNTPPAFNTLLEFLPCGKTVEIRAVSGSGKSAQECRKRIDDLLRAKGCTLESYTDLKQKTAIQELQ